MKPVHIDDYMFGRGCGCRSCGAVFAGEEAFNRHRIGEHGVDRRCTPNPRAVGLELTERGLWRRRR